MAITELFRSHLSSLELPPGLALVAVSGGPDSVALLDLLVHSRDLHLQELVVAHADHGIHPESAAVAEQVKRLATSYGLPVHIRRLKLGTGTGETRARTERYAWLNELRVRLGANIVFTAHHADDQAETVLMRVLAGSGPAGLAAIAPVSGCLVRPLLGFRRADLLRHLEETGLEAWLDPANADPRHLRSWIRSDLLPAIRARVPAIDDHLVRTSRQAARDRSAWDAILDVLPGLDPVAEDGGISVAASSLGGYDSPLPQALILAAARRAGCRLGPGRLGRVVSLLKGGASGTSVPLGGGWSAELAFGRLRIVHDFAAAPHPEWLLDAPAGQGSWGRWKFRWTPAYAPEVQERTATTAWFRLEPLMVRAWHAGERLKPLGGNGRRLLVRCFQERQVPRSRRDSWPVLARDQEILWVPGVCRSDVLLPELGTEALRVDAEYA